MKKNLLKIALLFSIIFGQISFAQNMEKNNLDFNSWIYFDLGDTIIDTKDPAGFKYFTNALQYILDLKAAGFKIGLITNIPEVFGPNYEEKLKTLKAYVAKKWGDSIPFDWDQFDNIIIPLNDTERKPAPILFSRALFLSNCPLVYFGENESEITAAQSIGLASKQVIKNNFLEMSFPDMTELKKLVKDQFKHPYSLSCN